MFANDTDTKGLSASFAFSFAVHCLVLLIILSHLNAKKNVSDSYVLTEISMIEMLKSDTIQPPVEIREPRKGILRMIIPLSRVSAPSSMPEVNLSRESIKQDKSSLPKFNMDKSRAIEAGFKRQITLENEIARKSVTDLKLPEVPGITRGHADSNPVSSARALSLTSKTTGYTPYTGKAISLNASQGAFSPAVKTSQPLTMPTPRETAQQADIKITSHKKLEIYGDAAARKLLKSAPPVYPAWAQKEGAKAVVTLSFTLLPDGIVKDNISVQSVSGQRELAQYAVEALKKFRFEPLSGTNEQKGYAVFRFELE